MHRIAIGSIFAALVLLLSNPCAHAQEGEDARTLFQRGQAAYAQGDYDASIQHWSRAYELDPRPLLQFNLSQAYERLGRLQEAVDALQVYLDRADPTDEHQADARARQAALRERIAHTSVRVTGGPEGATILVDGEDRGRTPRPDPIQVTPGSHRVIVRAQGYADFTSSVVVPAGQTVDIALQMEAAGTTVASSSEFPVGPVVLMGVGGAAIIAGAIMGGIALSDASSAYEGTTQADSARTLAIATDVTWITGAVLAASGLIWLFVAPSGSSSGEAQTQTALLPWATPNGAGLTLGGSF